MAQLVGRPCVLCGQPITSAPDAEFCAACGNAVHTACREAYEPPAEANEGACRVCGGSADTIPTKSAPAPSAGPSPLVPLLLLGIVVFIGYLAWPLLPGLTRRATPTASPAAGTETEAPAVPEGKTTQVTIETSKGTIRARLFDRRAPKTAANFVGLVEQEFYDGIIFHRVIKEFMVQTGDPLGQGTGGRTDKGLPASYLADEFHPELRHDRGGLLSMANSGPNTGDTQFFITTVPTPWLDNKHAIFGEVIEGMDVVKAIESMPTDADDRPLEEVKMISVRLDATDSDG